MKIKKEEILWLELIKATMRSKKLEVKALAQLMGCSHQTTLNVLSGNRSPSLKLLLSMYTALDLKQSELAEHFAALLGQKIDMDLVLQSANQIREVKSHTWIFASQMYFWVDPFYDVCPDRLIAGYKKLFFLTPGLAERFVEKFLLNWQKVVRKEVLSENLRVYKTNDNFCRLNVLIQNPSLDQLGVNCNAVFVGAEKKVTLIDSQCKRHSLVKEILNQVFGVISTTPEIGMEEEGYVRLA